MPHRIEKFCSTLKQALADILFLDLDNPDLKTISISNVTVSPDLKNARITVSTYLPDKDGIIEDLQNASGLIKHHLAKRMYLRFMPEITFQKDLGFEFDQKMTRLLSESKDA